jgi:hypothetical protein
MIDCKNVSNDKWYDRRNVRLTVRVLLQQRMMETELKPGRSDQLTKDKDEGKKIDGMRQASAVFCFVFSDMLRCR